MNHEAELNQVLSKLRDIETALNESSIVAITDEHGVIKFVNDKFCEISKYSREELIGKKHNIIGSQYHSQTFFKEIWETISSGNVWRGEIKNKAKDGTHYWVDTTIVPFLNDQEEPYQYISIRHDITKRKQYEKMIEKMAYYDPLTSLPNRNLLSKWMNEYSTKEDEHITVLFLDINRFKTINDQHGHHVGDYVLKKVSHRLKNSLHENDFISRIGWDEFIIFIKRIDKKQEIISIVNKILQQLSRPFYVENQQIILTTTIGISMSSMKEKQDDELQFIEELIKKADTAMLHAKKQSGNSYCFNTPDQNIEMDRYYQIEQELKLALETQQFFIRYQPIIDLASNKLVGVEALLRWYSPTLGFVSPSEFIPILEELGLIIPTGEWILHTVCTQMKAWQDEGIYLQKACVNVSPTQFHHEDFIDCIKRIIEETQLDPAYLELEITEGTILNIDETIKVFDDLKNLGVTISIDDFGTGYSSLRYLKQLPINTLKIDKSFIHDLDIDGKIIVNTIINMGKNLNYTVLAEGIEHKEQQDYLLKQGCHEGQGYLFSKPVENDELAKIYHDLNTGVLKK